ncbi:MAG TPA: GIY-YIG nuclease family protein [Ktedonobacterales bacterium]
MSSRREISRTYKERKLRGGVYTITNTMNGKYLIGHAADLASIRNRFQFAVMTGATVDPRVRADWETLGAQAFTLEVREELAQKPGQSQAEFLEDLKTLEQMWRAALDPAKEY